LKNLKQKTEKQDESLAKMIEKFILK